MNREKKVEDLQSSPDCRQTVVSGSYVSFYLDSWDPFGQPCKNLVLAPVKSICNDPLKRHETKVIVDVGGCLYGVPISELEQVSEPNGTQLQLF